MKKRIVAALASFAAALSLGAGALAAETLEGLLQKNYESRGGLEKLKSVKSLKMVGKIFQSQVGMDLPAVISQKHPNKMRIDMDFQDKTIVIGYDGQAGWMLIPFMGDAAQEMPPEQVKDFKESADMENPLVVYKEKGYQLELVGEEEMEGTRVCKLKLTKKEGPVFHYFLDAATGIELKTVFSMKQGDAEVQIDSIMGDYKPVDGVLMPFYIEARANGQVTTKITLDSIQMNPALDDIIFAMPGKTAAPAAEKK